MSTAWRNHLFSIFSKGDDFRWFISRIITSWFYSCSCLICILVALTFSFKLSWSSSLLTCQAWDAPLEFSLPLKKLIPWCLCFVLSQMILILKSFNLSYYRFENIGLKFTNNCSELCSNRPSVICLVLGFLFWNSESSLSSLPFCKTGISDNI